MTTLSGWNVRAASRASASSVSSSRARANLRNALVPFICLPRSVILVASRHQPSASLDTTGYWKRVAAAEGRTAGKMAKKRKPSSRSSRSRTPSHPSARSSRSRTPSHPSSGARTSSLPSRERSGTGDQQQPTATQGEPAQQGGDAAQGRMAKKGEKQRTPTSRQSASRTPSHHSSGAHTTSVRSGERSGSADEQRSGTQAKAMPIFPELAMARANTHPPTTRTSATRKAFDMYRSCVHAHEVARIHDEESSLKRFMGEHRLVVSSKDYDIDTVDLLVDLAVNWHLPFLFHLAPHWDNATGSLMLIVYPGSLGRYFTVSEQTRAAFPEYMRIHLSRGFANDTDFATLFRDFREWVEAATKVLHEPITDSDYPWLKFPFSGLGAYAENVDADAFLASVNRHYEKYALYGGRQRIQFSSGSTVFFTDKRVLMALDALLSNHSFTIPVSSYVAWKFLELFGWALDNKIAEIRFGETEKLLLLKARRVACANFVERTYGFAMTARYLMEKVDTQIRDTILGLLTRTQEAMLRLVARAPWMDARSRELFKLKVLQQKRYIWMSYQATYTNVLDNLYFDFPDMTENFVANWISSSKVLARKLLLNTSMDYIGRTDPALVRYLYHQNAQLIPMSLVFKPMYVPDGTPAINYAGLGAVYSQLLMQLFDTVGVLFNHNNDFVSWMTAPTLASHRVILQCLFKEQPQVEVWERLAFELIYEAFIGQKLQKQEGLRLQGLEEFSDDAVFYMSYCYMSCARTASKGTPVRRAHVCNAIKTTNHFRETFKCPPISDKRERAESKCRPFWNLTYHT
ncbi:uncharacterized protein LOC144151896 isoform X2 [Haemaphysalis longicornis]